VSKVLATISGTALAPGVSKNGRLYSREAIAKAVARAQDQLAEGKTLSVLTHHEAGDDSEKIIGRITGMSVAEDGSARFTADLADTPHARTIASLVDNSSGRPFLSGMSIRGAWVGKVQRVKGPDNQPVETAADLEFYGIDPTHKPGVEAAGVDAFAWAKGGATETTERVLITESVQEARVTAITEETTPAAPAAETVPAEVREALSVLLAGAPEIEEAGTPPMSKRDSGTTGSGRVWADPGYQPDKKQRYDITTKAVAKTAWSFINQQSKAAKYTPAQLKRIKGRIKAALKKFGVTVAAEGWTIEPAFQVTEAIAEYLNRPDMAGSFSLNACNGPISICISSYCLDPADLAVILTAACGAAVQALAALDPDMDGDIDVPGADSEDTDGDAADTTDQFDNGDGTADLARRILAAVKGESDESLDALVAEASAAQTRAEVTETSPTNEDPAPEVAAATQETEVPAVSETTTTEAAPPAAAAAFTQDQLNAAVAAALDEDRKARKAARKAAKAKTGESAGGGKAPVTETAPAAAAAAAPDLQKLVDAGIAAQLAAQGLVETQEQKIERMIAEGVTKVKQELVAAGGGPGRKGLVTEHTATRPAGLEGVPADFPIDGSGNMIPSEKWSEAQRRAAGAVLQTHVLGDRAVFD
jgi:hypothetical protein